MPAIALTSIGDIRERARSTSHPPVIYLANEGFRFQDPVVDGEDRRLQILTCKRRIVPADQYDPEDPSLGERILTFVVDEDGHLAAGVVSADDDAAPSMIDAHAKIVDGDTSTNDTAIICASGQGQSLNSEDL